ncbi:MAG: hypothetical protein WCO44_09475 [Bacteroidota bacterium]
MDQKIHHWLNSDQDYQVGLQLFDFFVKNFNLARILRVGGATGKNRLTLAYELGKLVQDLPAATQIPAIAAAPELSHENEPLPEVTRIGDLKSEQKMLYKMLDNLHAVLEFRPVQERKKIAFQILDLDDQLKELNERIAHYEKHGVIPELPVTDDKKKISELNDVELIQWQNNFRTYVARYKRLVAGSKTPKSLSRNQQLLEQYQRELEEITKRLQR